MPRVKKLLLSLLLIVMFVLTVFPLTVMAQTLIDTKRIEVATSEESREKKDTDQTEASQGSSQSTDTRVIDSATTFTEGSSSANELSKDSDEETPALVNKDSSPVDRSGMVNITGVNMFVDIGGIWRPVIKNGEIQPEYPTITTGMRIKFEYYWEIPSQNLGQFQPGDYFTVLLPDKHFKFQDTETYDLKDQNGDLIGHFGVKDDQLVSELNEVGVAKNEIKNGFFYGIGDVILADENIEITTGGFLLPPINIKPGGSSPNEEIGDYGSLSKSGAKFEEKGDLNWTIHANYDNAKKQYNGEEFASLKNVLLVDDVEEGLNLKEDGIKIEAPMYVANEAGRMTGLTIGWYSLNSQFTKITHDDGMSESDFVNAIKSSNVPAYGVYGGHKVLINFGDLPGANIKYPAWALADNGKHISDQLSSLVEANKISSLQAAETFKRYMTNPDIIGFVVTIPTEVTGGSKTYYNSVTMTYNDSDSKETAAKITFEDIGGGAETNEPGSVTIKKTDDLHQALSNIGFKLQKFNPTMDDYEDYLPQDGLAGIERITDSQGNLKFKKLSYGKFRVVETKTLIGYGEPIYSPSNEFEVTGEDIKGIEIAVVNPVLTGEVELVKTDDITSERLAGATFKLLDQDGQLISNGHQTNALGVLNIKGLLPGSYELIETQAPLGYQLDRNPIKFRISKSQTTPTMVSKTNKQIPGALILGKSDEETGEKLAGAIFELQDSHGITISGDHQTNSQGVLSIEDLLPGNYQLVETRAPKGYVLDQTPLVFEITKGQTSATRLFMTNHLPLGTVVLTKRDHLTDKTLAGAVFSLQTQKGALIVDKLETDEFGKLPIFDLEPGAYQLVETKAPAGYLLDETPLLFELKPGQTETLLLSQTNEQQAGSIILTKRDAQTTNVLVGAIFELQDVKGKVMERNLKSDAKGQVVVTDLKPGKYSLVETQAPEGYVIDRTPVALTIDKQTTNAQVVKMNTKKQSVDAKRLTEKRKRLTVLPKTGEEAKGNLIGLGLLLVLAVAVRSRKLKQG